MDRPSPEPRGLLGAVVAQSAEWFEQVVHLGRRDGRAGSPLDNLAYLLDHTGASIVSMSMGYGISTGLRQAYAQIFQEGARQGVGFYFSSGDGGTAIDTGSFLNPASSSAWQTSVGGTSLAIGPDGSRMWETGWGDGVNMLSSDDTSWQQPIEQADGATGMLVGGTPLGGSPPTTDPNTWQYTELGLGGTSLAAPLFASVQALTQQARGKRLGFANRALYRRADSPAIRDIDKYTLPDHRGTGRGQDAQSRRRCPGAVQHARPDAGDSAEPADAVDRPRFRHRDRRGGTDGRLSSVVRRHLIGERPAIASCGAVTRVMVDGVTRDRWCDHLAV